VIKEQLDITVTIDKGRTGSFEVTVDDKLIFSKLKENRFPEDSEILNQLK